jgi:hypothetical protein
MATDQFRSQLSQESINRVTRHLENGETPAIGLGSRSLAVGRRGHTR